jgi:carboxypeptidase Taq
MEENLFNKFLEQSNSIADINSATAILGWDQETYMPEKGAAMRSQQLATLSGIAHDQFTSDETQDLVDSLQTIIPDLTFAQQRNVSEVAKALDRAKKFSREFVMRSSRITSQCFQAWQYAKQHNDFEKYQQPLAEMVALKREACEILGYKNHPYDALIDQYEPETTTADVITLFDDVRQQLVDFVAEIANKPLLTTVFCAKITLKNNNGILVLTCLNKWVTTFRQVGKMCLRTLLPPVLAVTMCALLPALTKIV